MGKAQKNERKIVVIFLSINKNMLCVRIDNNNVELLTLIWKPDFYNKIDSHKFEVLRTRDFISNYRKIELKGGRHK